MAKLNIILSILYVFNAMGLVITMLALLVLIFINKPLTNTIYKAPLQWLTGVKTAIAAEQAQQSQQKRDIDYTAPYINEDIDSVIKVYSGLNQEMLPVGTPVVAETDTSKVTHVYGPSSLLRFWSIMYLFYAIMFFVMGGVYIACEYDTYAIAKKVYNCNMNLRNAVQNRV